MNTAILQKCLDELSKEQPKLDYVRGMLETLIALQTPLSQVVADRGNILGGGWLGGAIGGAIKPPTNVTKGEPDEASILEASAAASISKIRALSQKSLES